MVEDAHQYATCSKRPQTLYIINVCVCVDEPVHHARILQFHIFFSVSHRLSRQNIMHMRGKQENTGPHMGIICVPDTAFLGNAVVLTYN